MMGDYISVLPTFLLSMGASDFRILTVMLLPVGGFLIAWLVLRRKRPKSFVALILRLTVISGIASIGAGFLLRTDAGGLAWPISMLGGVVLTVIAILVAFRFFGLYIFRSEQVLDYSQPDALHRAVSTILDSEKFLTALRATLPLGKEDKEFGLDYIPYMISSVDERRKRATKSARLFLIATVVAALIFSGVVMYFGYILVNEAAAGTARTLAEVRDSTKAISETLQSIVPSYYRNPMFQRDVAPSLTKLDQTPAGEKNNSIEKVITDALEQCRNTGDFSTLNSAFGQVKSQLSRESPEEKAYAATFETAADKLSEFINDQSNAVPRLAQEAAELRLLTSKAEDSLSKPENRTPELIKRLGLGLVISTFFLALLRYLGNLYRTRYLQVLEAERDDFMVRRFYVAFKNSVDNDEQRKVVLTSFMTAANGLGMAESKETPDESTKQEFEVIKELLKAMSKKM